MAATPQPGSGLGPPPAKDDLDREVERRAHHVAEEESDPLTPAREERARQEGKH